MPITVGSDTILIDRWCHLGTAADEEALWMLIESSSANETQFDLDIYKVLRKHLSRPDKSDVRFLAMKTTSIGAPARTKMPVNARPY